MSDDIRKTLDQATHRLLESLSGYDKQKVTQVYAGMRALMGRDVDPVEQLLDPEQLTELLREQGIGEDQMQIAANLIHHEGELGSAEQQQLESLPESVQDAVNEIRSHASQEQIFAGPAQIASALNLIKKETRDALIASQVGERILQARERVDSRHSASSASKHTLLVDTLYDFGSNTNLARDDIGHLGQDDPYLIAAKATQHLADLFDTVLALQPAMKKQGSVVKGLEAIEFIAKYILEQSAVQLKNHGNSAAAGKIDQLAQSIQQKYTSNSIEPAAAIIMIKTGLAYASSILHKEGVFNDKEYEDMLTLLEIRGSQAAALV
tara:strand:+ start:650 stop:1618 length:969 start_codon:yes stop_codon:yes gene_type:complete